MLDSKKPEPTPHSRGSDNVRVLVPVPATTRVPLEVQSNAPTPSLILLCRGIPVATATTEKRNGERPDGLGRIFLGAEQLHGVL